MIVTKEHKTAFRSWEVDIQTFESVAEALEKFGEDIVLEFINKSFHLQQLCEARAKHEQGV